MEVFIIGGILFLLLLLIILGVICSKKKMKRELLKIEEADNNIDLYLENKRSLFGKISKTLKDIEDISSIKKISFEEVDHFRMHEILEDYHGKLKKILTEEEELLQDKKLQDLVLEINENNCNLYGSIKFYNDSVDHYLSLKSKFPTKLIKLFCGFKKFDTYEIKTSKKVIY